MIFHVDIVRIKLDCAHWHACIHMNTGGAHLRLQYANIQQVLYLCDVITKVEMKRTIQLHFYS